MNFKQKQEAELTKMAAVTVRRGFTGGSPIVYRDPVDTGLAVAFYYSATGGFKADVDFAVTSAHKACVIGTRNEEDNTRIRKAVESLRKMVVTI